MEELKAFLKRKQVNITVQAYLIDALGAMAFGLFASLLIGLPSSGNKQLPQVHSPPPAPKPKLLWLRLYLLFSTRPAFFFEQIRHFIVDITPCILVSPSFSVLFDSFCRRASNDYQIQSS